MISALAWVERGVAKEQPLKYDLNDDEFSRIKKITSKSRILEEEAKIASVDAEVEVDADADMDMVDAEAETETRNSEMDPELAEYDLDNYDDEDFEEKEMGLFGKMKELAYHKAGEKDPYLVMGDKDEDQDSELEDVLITAKDNLILVARTEDEISQLEVYVYERDNDHLYVHHDLLLPTFPLCLEWLDFRSSDEKGNLVAIGTFEPQIEIWDLDVLDAAYPKCLLGEGKQKKKKIPRPDRHVAAVMSLNWNRQHKHLLASSSADHTVKLWDLTQEKAVFSFDHHKDKVQSVLWHPVESTVMMTASFDKTVALFDSRAPASCAKLSISADPEIIRWYPQHPERCLIGLENGLVFCHDMRAFNEKQGSLFTLHAHDSAVSAMDISANVSGCLVTGSTDQSIKVWDIESNRPKHVLTRSMEVGKIFCASFCPDAPLLLSVAGSEGKLQLWDLASKVGIRNSFKGRGADLASVDAAAEKDPITVDDDVTDSDSDEAYDPPDLEGVDQSESEEDA